MMTVWKYPISPTMELSLPHGAEVLSVQVQKGEPQMWVLVNDTAPLEQRRFEMYGTGHPIPHPLSKYIGTFQLPPGNLVFHVFEKPRAG